MRTPIVIFIPAVVASAWLILLLSGGRLLVSETKVQLGQHYVVANYGNLGEAKQPSLVCKYFTGRGFVTRVYWYSPNNIFGKDECPFMARE